VPLFIETIYRDFRRKDGGALKFRPFVWPMFLGPSKGCYAITAAAARDNTLSANWVFLVAPGRSIKLGDVFVGEFSFVLGATSLQVHKMLDASELSFILTDIDGGHPRSVPRGVIKRFHKVVGLFEQQE
jgi:hypothetical protein